MNWKKATLDDVERECRECIRIGHGIGVSPRWLLALIQDYRLLTRDDSPFKLCWKDEKP